MKIFYCIISLFFTFSKQSLNAQDIQQSPNSTADYVEMKKRLHEVDIQLKVLLNKIDSHQRKKRSDSTKVKGKEGNKNHTHNKVLEIKNPWPKSEKTYKYVFCHSINPVVLRRLRKTNIPCSVI